MEGLVKVRFAILGVALLALPILCMPAAAANLVANGGFETGDFTDWINGGDTSFTGLSTGDPVPVFAGNYSGFFGPLSDGTLSQDVVTVAGMSYVVSFYLYNGALGANGFSGS